jgi:hypothetical protein
VNVFDPNKRTSISFEKCVNLATQRAKLTQEEAGLLRAVDALRDAEQHWLIIVPEDVLYLHARGFITTFDDLLKRTLDDTLADHLPSRVLPISTQPPIGFNLLVDREFKQVRELLRPGKRQRDEARGRIRTLLAMESHVAPEVDISEADIDGVETAIRSNKSRGDVFPRLGNLDTQISGTGATVRVHFPKKAGEGAPVRFIAADDPTEARQAALHPNLLSAFGSRRAAMGVDAQAPRRDRPRQRIAACGRGQASGSGQFRVIVIKPVHLVQRNFNRQPVVAIHRRCTAELFIALQY